MSEPSLFWIEQDRLDRLLLEAGLKPSSEAVRSRSAAALPAAGVEPVPSFLTQPSPLPEAARRAEPELMLPDGPLEARCEALLQWLRDAFGCERAFLADGDGLTLLARALGPELPAAAASMGMLWRSLRSSIDLKDESCFSIQLAPEATLYVVMSEAGSESLHLGFVSRATLTSATLAKIRRAFHLTVLHEGTRP
jgi:hypothetical protein